MEKKPCYSDMFLLWIVLCFNSAQSTSKMSKYIGQSSDTFGTVNISKIQERINVSAWNELYNFLLENYDKFHVPLNPRTGTGTNVTVYLWPYDILTVNEANSRIQLSGWIDMKNTDFRLKWDPADFAGIEAIFLPAIKVWQPNIELFYSKDSKTGPTNDCHNCPVRVRYNGDVFRGYYFAYSFPCTFNVRYFPFDRQVCKMQLANWHMDDRMMNLYAEKDIVNMSIFLRNEEWDLLNMNVTRDSQFYAYGYFPVLEYTLEIKRKPFYYIVNLVVPSLMLTVTALVGYHMPSTGQGVHQEKVKMGLTTILSIYILQLGISDKLPRTSGTTPLLVVFYSILVGLLSSATVTTSLVILIEKQGIYGKPVPQYIRKWIPALRNKQYNSGKKTNTDQTHTHCRKLDCGCRLRKRWKGKNGCSPLLEGQNVECSAKSSPVINHFDSCKFRSRKVSEDNVSEDWHESPISTHMFTELSRRIRYFTNPSRIMSDDFKNGREEKNRLWRIKCEWSKLADFLENVSLFIYLAATALTTLYFATHAYV